ncbi:MAG TPA: substrate-binding domain-containing protein [Casimicrobiaceae bacterium]|jgi:molybdate transport system substrate-binding protein|nr:substrate-binding domain-containing protein [Casimicrobiaceae bacterium]
MTVVRVLSAGAAKQLVRAIAGEFETRSGARVDATFDAAGAIRSAFEASPDSDLVILPDAMLDALASAGRVERASIAALGNVSTGVAVRDGDVAPQVDDADALRHALGAASALYCPDIERSTAGRHFLKVLQALGIAEDARPKLRAYANGATAMAALAREGPSGALGCTQATEILYTPGVTLVAPLPPPFALSTRYALAVSTRATSPDIARIFAAQLTSPENAALRRRGGFEI